MIEAGQKVTFDPFGQVIGFCAELNRGNYVTGTVVYVNKEHRWFSVEYGDPKARTSFNFWDIGKVVEICG